MKKQPSPAAAPATLIAPFLGIALFCAAALAVHRVGDVGVGRAFVTMVLGWFAVILTMCFCELLREALDEAQPEEPGADGFLGRERAMFRHVLGQAASGAWQDLFAGAKQLGVAAGIALIGFVIDRAFPVQMHTFSVHVLLLTTGWMTGTGFLILNHQLARRMAPPARTVKSGR